MRIVHDYECLKCGWRGEIEHAHDKRPKCKECKSVRLEIVWNRTPEGCLRGYGWANKDRRGGMNDW